MAGTDPIDKPTRTGGGWVFCGGMFRAGSTLQFQIVAHVVEQAGLGRRVPWAPPEEFPRIRDEWSEYCRLKVFKTHRMTGAIQAEFDRCDAKAVYIYRDLRDVVASWIRKHDAAFDRVFFDRDLVGESLAMYDLWTARQSVLISRYEDAVSDLPAEVARIATFLGVGLTPAECDRVAVDYSIDRQLARIGKLKEDPARGASGGTGQVFDRDSLLHTNHIASGRHGAWSDVLTDLQVAMIERQAGGWLVDRGYELVSPRLSFMDRLRLKRM